MLPRKYFFWPLADRFPDGKSIFASELGCINKVYKSSTSIKSNTDTLVKDPFIQYIVTYFAPSLNILIISN